MATTTTTTTATSSSTTTKPKPPFTYLSSSSSASLNLTDLNDNIRITEEAKQETFTHSRAIQAMIVKHRSATERNVPLNEKEVVTKELIDCVEEAMNHHSRYYQTNNDSNNTDNNNKNVRLAHSLSYTIGDYVRELAYHHFLQSGELLSQSRLLQQHHKERDLISDEEYLMGIIGLNHDLARYAIGRATERDVDSVCAARDLVSLVLEWLMKFDFRNGNLRRRYDGVKYCLKTCETVLYELSVTGCDVPNHHSSKSGGGGKESNSTKRRKLSHSTEASKTNSSSTDEQSSSSSTPRPQLIIPIEELEKLRRRVETRDELRENLIKDCRDAQKKAKQAIYALHRQKYDPHNDNNNDNFSKEASNLLETCEQLIKSKLNPTIEKEPQLRYGSYSNVLEEWVEAKLFHVWLSSKTILHPQDFNKITTLQPEEYLGGLSDLTGEIVRFAVKRGTLRDETSVKRCLETNLSILYALQSLVRLPGNVGKKMEATKRNVEKLERMLYEMSLSKATGRKVITKSGEGDGGKRVED